MKILYGIESHKIDITHICFQKLTYPHSHNHIIWIPYSEVNRCKLFTDPTEGYLKKIYILLDIYENNQKQEEKQNILLEYDCDQNIMIDLKYKTIFSIHYDTLHTHIYYYDIEKIDRFFSSNSLDISHTHGEKMRFIYENPRIEFRLLCFYYLQQIRSIPVKYFPQESDYETVLIEYRSLPHTEFLIRNIIHKLGNYWSHTVVCGTDNYSYMVEMCRKIHPNLKVIQTPFSNHTQKTYSDYLCTLDFWNLFTGKKVLLYQEDTCVFKGNIERFLMFDWLGSPWIHPLVNPGGNGGFSLRTRQIMIDVIQFHDSTFYFPEDKYFVNTIHKEKLGILADYHTNYHFSTENIVNRDSLGGHQFWNFDPNWKHRMYRLLFDSHI